MTNHITVATLCSGIGGPELAFEAAGFTVIWHAEIDPFCCEVLREHWPTVPNLGDITTIDWNAVETPAVLHASYPCQPFSFAGNRRGSQDERHLWPFVRDAIRVLRPRVVVLENVAGHLSLGFDEVLADLAALGFDAEWSIVSACSVGAPHVRRRLFVVAHPGGNGQSTEGEDLQGARRLSQVGAEPARGCGVGRPKPRAWLPEPDVGRVVDGIPGRVVARHLHALGNAVVPAAASVVVARVVDVLMAVDFAEGQP
jgi:DNA (cytosine-5)-methyltransferase 1